MLTVEDSMDGVWVWLAAAAIALLAFVSISWLALPASLPVLVATGMLESFWYGLQEPWRTRALYAALVGLPPLLVPLSFGAAFVRWCEPLRRGDVVLPTRSLIVAALLAALSAAWYAVGWRYGMEYQGPRLLGRYVGASVVALLALAILAAHARHAPTAWSNLLFHTLLFAWAIAVAFPWLGETF